MNEKTQLLSTFTTTELLDATIDDIVRTYKLTFDKLYVLENADDPTQLIITYNISQLHPNVDPLPATVSVHRKKFSNTIYTINAINRLIEEKNNGVLDMSYRINWDELRNMLLITANTRLKKINTQLVTILNT
jgi:hypothetical protein